MVNIWNATYYKIFNGSCNTWHRKYGGLSESAQVTSSQSSATMLFTVLCVFMTKKRFLKIIWIQGWMESWGSQPSLKCMELLLLLATPSHQERESDDSGITFFGITHSKSGFTLSNQMHRVIRHCIMVMRPAHSWHFICNAYLSWNYVCGFEMEDNLVELIKKAPIFWIVIFYNSPNKNSSIKEIFWSLEAELQHDK